ncbi:MAG: adenylate/guanylate cyclase domain-containing protein, partial [Planctomycetota bacterium]|nr:adenylate/guanylate cyclase domain-containing protein [Planctomycetota bacterium]
IVLVDIDDNALDTIGRWPWPRKIIADAVRAIDALGARVIALDLLLIDSQGNQVLLEEDGHFDVPGSGTRGTLVHHDNELAAALRDAHARTVLAARAEVVGAIMGHLWLGEDGQRKWGAIVKALSNDINLEAGQIIDRAGLKGERAARVHDHTNAIKRRVIRRMAAQLRREGRLTEVAMRKELLPPDKNERLRHFRELPTIRNAIAFERAADAIEAKLPAYVPGPDYARVGSLLPPLPKFAQAVTAVGIVDAEQDADGQLRRVRLRWERAGKVYLQFGLAAAAAYLGRDLNDFAGPSMRVGPNESATTLHGEIMLLTWPEIPDDRPILGAAEHVSLGRVVDLVRNEETLRRHRRNRDTITKEFLRSMDMGYKPEDLDNAELRDQIEREVAEQVEWDLNEQEPGVEDNQVRARRRWLDLSIEIERGALELRSARVGLRRALNDRLAFIGWNATGNFGDFYPTAAHERTPGVVAHALVANSFLTGDLTRPAPRWIAPLLALLFGVVASWLTGRLGPLQATLLTGAVALAFVSVNTFVVFGRLHIMSATVAPLLGLAAGFAGTLLVRAVRERREKAQLRRQFGARISRRLFDFLIEHPDQVHLDGEEREVTCYFSDLVGFTTISEKLDSKTTVALLNRYMWAMNDELTKVNAYVNKFLGDGIMSVWGAFATGTPHAQRACEGALHCARRLEDMRSRGDFAGLPPLGMRIGLATGVVTVGDCGAPPDLRDYTVIGDSVNLAARLESANKQFDTRTLIDGRTRELVSDEIVTRYLGKISVVGQKADVDVHELVGKSSDVGTEQREWIERTTEAVTLFQKGGFPEAYRAWQALGERFGKTKLDELYLAQIESQLQQTAHDFDGVLRLTRK